MRVGVTEFERSEPQRIVCNITLWPEQTVDIEDEIEKAVDYSAVADWVRKFASQSKFRLIETFADGIAKGLLTGFRVRKVAVEVRKFVLSDTGFVSVTASQTGAEG